MRLRAKPFITVALSAVLTVLPLTAQAQSEPYETYIYRNEKAAPSLSGYAPLEVYSYSDMALETALDQPLDLFVDDERQEVLLLDSGNGRVIILDKALRAVTTLDRFDFDGEELSLGGPGSICLKDENTLVIADTGNERVVVCDRAGKVKEVLTKPSSEVFPQDTSFIPLKVASYAGKIYVLCRDIYQGAVVFDNDYHFERFYGANQVNLSAKLLLDRFWKTVMNEEQSSGLANYIPVEFTNLDIDSEGFVYTVTGKAGPADRLRKMNAIGANIIGSGKKFGDLDTVYDSGTVATNLVDVAVGENGYIYALNATWGRVFQYDSEFNLIFEFGALGGKNKGTFSTPVALDTLDSRVLVLDSTLGTVTTFTTTEFGDKVHSALQLYREGSYEDALGPWQEILELDNHYQLAHKGVGDGLYMMGEYRQAMQEYKNANAKADYLKAMREYRNGLLHQWFALVLAVIVAVILLVVWLLRRHDRKRRGGR